MTEIQSCDVLIIGAGINGCGVFRDLSAQGVSCVMIDRADFCSGASAASSRLMHGGLKYLETGEFDLVQESLIERNRLLVNAAHIVRPLPTVLPLRAHWAGLVPTVARFLGAKTSLRERGSLISRLGMTVYDIFARSNRVMPTHRYLRRKRLDAHVSGLDSGIKSAILYYEGQITAAERLGLELIEQGEALNAGSRAYNYAHIQAIAGDAIRISHPEGELRIRARVIVNAAGAWIDGANSDLGHASRLMRGSKGSHLVVRNAALHDALNGHMVYFGTPDGRVNLCYPFEEAVIIGSTDIPVENPDLAQCDTQETLYMLDAVSGIFPDIKLSADDIRYRFCGVRPLPNATGDIGQVTRNHSIARIALPDGTPVLCLVGGKWTTFRAFAEQASDQVLDLLKRSRLCDTRKMQIGGGSDYPGERVARSAWVTRVAQDSGLTEDRVAVLLSRYGTCAEVVARACDKESPLRDLPGYSDRELDWICRNERVVHLSDLLLRRTLVAMCGALTPGVIAQAAAIAAKSLGWSGARTEEEIAEMLRLVEDSVLGNAA